MRIRHIIKGLMTLLLSIFLSVSMADEIASVSVDRAWGLLLGDVVRLQVDLVTAAEEIDISSLPQIDKRYGTWLYLKDLELDQDQLLFTYQLVNVPTENRLIATPNLKIRQLNDNWLVIPAVTLVIGPLLPDYGDDSDNIIVKENHAPTLISTVGIERKLILFAVLSIVSTLVLLIWHVGWKLKNRQPFAQAVYALSRLRRKRSTHAHQASRILHAAFNRTADTIVVHSKLDQVFDQVPWLIPLKADIDSFYLQSANHFFTRNAEQEPGFDSVRKLAKACRAKEKLA